MENSKLQWHPAFFAALQIELEDEIVPLQFTTEFNLTKKPLQIDVLIVKKEGKNTLRKNFVKLFRKHNIIEYKSGKKHFSVNDYYKVIAYACLYQSNTNHVLEINPRDITITLACSKFPRKLIKHLQKYYHSALENPFPGVYYISGTWFPLQIWMIGKLSKEETLWLNSLRPRLTLDGELRDLEQAYQGKEHIPNYETVMDVIVRANRKTLKGDETMCRALREMFAEDFKKSWEDGKCQGELNGKKEGELTSNIRKICRKLNKNKPLELIADELEESLEYTSRIYNIAKNHAPDYDIEKIYQELIATS